MIAKEEKWQDQVKKMLDHSRLRVLRSKNIPDPVDTILFLGAGASQPFGYPPSDEFINQLRLDEDERRWISAFDTIDDVMRHCHKLLAGRDETLGELMRITYNTAEEIRPMPTEEKRSEVVNKIKNIPEIYEERVSIAKRIEEKVTEGIFREYSYRDYLDEYNYLDEYMQVLRKKNGDHLPVFTTNYDPAVENLEVKGYEVNTLFTHSRRAVYIWSGQEAFKREDKRDDRGRNVIHLFKLHGSTYWRWRDSKLYEERASSQMVVEKEEIIPPGMIVGIDRNREPYITYWDYFDSYLTQAKKAVFLGYRFDDGEIWSLLDSRPLEKIVVVNTRPVDLDWENVVRINKPAQDAVEEVEEALG